MPITPVTFANHYTLTLEVKNNSGPETWRNSMDLVYAVGTVPTPSDAPIVAFEQWLQGITRPDATIVKATCRAWARGDQPFSTQAAIFEATLNLVGQAYASGGLAPTIGAHNPTLGEVVAEFVKPVFAGGGKPGRLFVRNLYRDIDVTSVAGGPPVLTGVVPGPDAATLNTFTNTKLAAYCEDNPLPRFCIVHWSKIHNPTSPFDSAIGVPVWSSIGMHDLSHKSPK